MGNRYPLIPYSVIEAASTGDQSAIKFVLTTYKSYISSLCMKTVYLENGTAKVCVDDFMCRRLEAKLMAKMTVFNIDR